ncbi:MAG TPA: DUF4383 domain-containing protein [Solirubrobacterales bacterium]|nr:DUF4383 domain-containing protein [Solirubrobacterales bacterium]
MADTSYRDNDYTPASLYAVLIGGVLLVAGIIGFFYSASFGSPGNVDAVLGILDVNAWHNLVHIASGVVGLLAFASGPRASRTYALVFGVVYIIVAIWGFIIGSHESILGFIPVNTEDNILHVILGVLGVGAYAASDPAAETRATRTTRAA